MISVIKLIEYADIAYEALPNGEYRLSKYAADDREADKVFTYTQVDKDLNSSKKTVIYAGSFSDGGIEIVATNIPLCLKCGALVLDNICTECK